MTAAAKTNVMTLASSETAVDMALLPTAVLPAVRLYAAPPRRRATLRSAMPTFLDKAEQSLAGAASEFAAVRFDNCANRCYYACFQAAIFALQRAGVAPRGRGRGWAHDFVQAEFTRRLTGES